MSRKLSNSSCPPSSHTLPHSTSVFDLNANPMPYHHHGFVPMQQAHSMAQLNYPCCQTGPRMEQQQFCCDPAHGSNMSLNMYPPQWMGTWHPGMYPYGLPPPRFVMGGSKRIKIELFFSLGPVHTRVQPRPLKASSRESPR